LEAEAGAIFPPFQKKRVLLSSFANIFRKISPIHDFPVNIFPPVSPATALPPRFQIFFYKSRDRYSSLHKCFYSSVGDMPKRE
jgi:hypothetical protein